MVENINDIIRSVFFLMIFGIGTLTVLMMAASIVATMCVDAFVDIQKKIEEVRKNK